MSKRIKEYWDDRANLNQDSLTATTRDIYQRELEIKTIVGTLEKLGISEGASVMDVGCGDGYSTIEVARKFPKLTFFGVDYAPSMVKSARKRLGQEEDLRGRVSFECADMQDLDSVCNGKTYAVVFTMRCLINLDSIEAQELALNEIAEHVKSDGYYIAIENFVETHDNMNKARKQMGLPEIPIRWHNLYFSEEKLRSILAPNYRNVDIDDFSSSYYYATRVIYSAMCKMEGVEPDYHHPIHRLAVDLPRTGKFSPIRMVRARRK
jgi:ubiquinone/menaquinone biosynthesis C-methylase UbiE